MGYSSLTPQLLVDYARAACPKSTPVLGVSGYSDEPALSFSDDIIKKIMAKKNPWKWNMIAAAPFYTQPYQQDYPTNISSKYLGWLTNATMIDINNSTNQPPIQPPIMCVARLLPTSTCGYPSSVCWMPNNIAITGLWPGPSVVFVNPLTSQGGGPSNNPLTAIKDPNGNIQVVTTYGVTTSNSAGPSWPASGATPGTITQDGTVQWTLIDPLGIAFRVDRIATFNSNVWQMLVQYQNKAPNMTSLGQTFAPVPDDLNFLIKQGFVAYCQKLIDNGANFKTAYAEWIDDMNELMGASDREDQEFGFYPAYPLSGGGSSGGGNYSYPGWNGWGSDGN
jgi:hypothetical protein